MPTASLWKNFFSEVKHYGKTLTETESNRIKARLTWSQVVSSIDTENEAYARKFSVMNSLILRLQRLGVQNANAEFVQKCVNYLQDNSRIILTFDAATVLKDGLKAFRPLNVFENNARNKNPQYFANRTATENGLFAALNAALKQQLLESDNSARPKYACLMLNEISPITNYGKSFIVFKTRSK